MPREQLLSYNASAKGPPRQVDVIDGAMDWGYISRPIVGTPSHGAAHGRYTQLGAQGKLPEYPT